MIYENIQKKANAIDYKLVQTANKNILLIVPIGCTFNFFARYIFKGNLTQCNLELNHLKKDLKKAS